MSTCTTPPGITRDEAFALLKSYLKNDRTIAHCLASEAIMRRLAVRFGDDPEAWGLAGLLHDLDYEHVAEDPARHGNVAAEVLKEAGVPEKIIEAIRMHNAEGLGLTRSGTMAHALTCAESITGLIVATALVYPDKRLASVKPQSVTKRMGTAHFARAVSRERIRECETIGIPLPEFAALSLSAMTDIAETLGL